MTVGNVIGGWWWDFPIGQFTLAMRDCANT